ncbi:MAG: hypothetical protein PVSMB7_29250 [Chloroflexota bacterium]
MNDRADTTATFLRDGGQSAEQVALQLAAFLAGARTSIDIAAYDCGLGAATGDIIRNAIAAARARDVIVRLGYFLGGHTPPGVPPQTGTSAAFAASLQCDTKPITAFRGLMHHKYVVRDAGSPHAAVWTGSTNWTDDAFAREENIIVVLPSDDLATYFRRDFDDLWSAGAIENSGGRDGGTASLTCDGEAATVEVWFSPGGGVAMAQAVADAIAQAKQRIVIASPVLTVGTVLGALRDAQSRNEVTIRGVYDWTQMREVLHQWSDEPQATWKVKAFTDLVQTSHMAGKHSTPFAPGSVHDYMHMKSIVVDDAVFTGSYNFSHSGEDNAENLLRIECSRFADDVAAVIDGLIGRYGRS